MADKIGSHPRIALIGLGKMGREVERLAAERGFTVGWKMNSATPAMTADAVNSFDVAIHFASTASVLGHVGECARYGKNMVIGTTGWSADIGKVRSMAEAGGIGVIHSSNFSVGMHLFSQLADRSASMANRFSEYDAYIHEIHHKDKADSPSGTALSLASILLKRLKRKKELLTTTPAGKIRPEQLHVTSTRSGAVVGIHRVVYDSSADSIELVHTAKNRSGFAWGVLLAADWIQGRKGMHTFEEVFTDE